MDKDNVTRLMYGDKEIILVGTAHVSKESTELVRQVIAEETPDSVCIELDEQRYDSIQNPKRWESTDIVKVVKSKKVGFLIANLILSGYQKKLAKKLGTNVGGEMLEAIASAKDVNAQLVLADRNIQTTLLRIWRKLSLWEKLKLIFSLTFSFGEDTEISSEDLQELLKEDMLESAISGLRKQFPAVGQILISERDQYLAFKIKNAPGQKIVAVLGGAHVPGVKKEIFKEQDIESISVIPPKSKISKITAWIIPALITGLFVYAFIMNIQTGLQQLSAWVLWTGLLASLFTALCLGHPLSIITSFIAAPITTLHPMLACGWFAGLVEATIKKPTVQDVQNIQEDIFSLKGVLKNRFLKTLLVVIMSNIGASIGTFIAGTGIIRNLL
ncbi:TraB/GumN family protein [Ruminiclostridium cellobioparum]|uniref:TraB/GumN family protein n=1 Tax=Ruminiclostridium cellobioparum TaxID=29355 RepID=UPI000485B21D|nr:TraB/GumN family protein [Ruminiclostridium cellobioparum]